MYSTCVSPLIPTCLEGYNAIILAYRQTGSEKTHTVIGDLEREGNQKRQEDTVELGNSIGFIPWALHDIFLGLEKIKAEYQQGNKEDDEVGEINQRHSLTSSSQPPFEYQIKVQLLELYGEQILDLVTAEIKTENDRNGVGKESSNSKRRVTLNSLHRSRPRKNRASKKKVHLALWDRNGGEDTVVVGIYQAKVESAEKASLYLKHGMDRHCTERTTINATSSRSHAIFNVLIQ